jgi:plastocyanin
MLGAGPVSSEEQGAVLRPCANVDRKNGLWGRYLGFAAVLAVACSAVDAGAAALLVTVTRPDGSPLKGAVVMLHGPAGSTAKAPATFVVDQVDQAFTPDLTIIPVGSTVTFPNSDKTSHQVYSFSPAKRFQLPLYRGTPYAPTKFENAGIVTLGCNIHDDMIAYLIVTDAAWFGRTGPDGSWTASDLPAGDFRIEVWHPRLREQAQVIERQLVVDASQSNTLDVKLTRTLRPEPLGRKPRSWGDY